MEAVVFVIIVYLALREGIEYTRKHWGQSRTRNRKRSAGKGKSRRVASAVHHDVGYWLHQLLNVFPEFRHGVAAGWHTGRQSQAEAETARHKARAEHLETRAARIPEIIGFRRRQAEALEKIRQAKYPEPGPVEVVPSPPGRDDPLPAEAPAPPPPGGGPDSAVVTAAPPPPKGTPVSDTTYDGVTKLMQHVRDTEDEALTERHNQVQEADTASEEMQALDVNPGTLSAMAEHVDAQQAAQKAEQRVMETADDVLAALKSDQALAEAHRENPHAAKREFYEEG